ncbi:MAG: hypothetical protein K0R67_2937 [Paenibacillus sp.]|nr:hypothetical protein [Paenibacillus sp.]
MRVLVERLFGGQEIRYGAPNRANRVFGGHTIRYCGKKPDIK